MSHVSNICVCFSQIDELIAPDRELLYEGVSDVKINGDNHSAYTVLLFSDIILLCKSGGVLR